VGVATETKGRVVLVSGVFVEPPLQTLSGETLTYSTAIAEDAARYQLMEFGVASTSGLILMRRLRHHTAPLLCHHCIGSSKRRSGEGMSRGSER